MMLVRSMTGYGSETFHRGDMTLTVEIRTVNSRFLDFIAKIPRSLYELEIEFKKIIQTYFERGRVELYISAKGSLLEERSLYVDWDLMDEFFKQLGSVKERYDLKGDIPISIITAMDELFQIKEEKRADDAIHQFILNSVEEVAKQVQRSRETEGAFIMKDILKRLENVEADVERIDEMKELVHSAYHERIKERIEAHLEDNSSVDQNHLLQEIAILAEKSDITEEITRLFSHLEHFKQTAAQSGAIGRKLDFIIQEMHRETNTIGAKSADASISELVVQIKSNLEKMKEQVQNIE